MDIRDCKIGTRVVCVKDEHGKIPSGGLGTIIENKTTCPLVAWDEYFDDIQFDVNGYENVCTMYLQELDVLEENTSEKQAQEEVIAKETNLGKLSVSLATEDVNEIAKDILKIILQELYEGIENLSKDLDEDAVKKEQVLTEQDVLDRLLGEIVFAAENKDDETALKLSQAYQHIKSVQNI